MSLNSAKKNYDLSHLYSVMIGGFVSALLSPIAAADTPETRDQFFLRVRPSVVGLSLVDTDGGLIGHGSGVLIDTARVITTCQVVKDAKSGHVHRPSGIFKAVLQHAEPARDLCQMKALQHLQSPPIVLGTAKKIRIGQRVYAIGTRKSGKGREGWESLLSEAVVSNLRPYGGSQYIQISPAIAPSSSGGGLFDEQGRLIGILSVQFIEGENFTFALPADWVVELANRTPATQRSQGVTKKNGLNWLNHTLALEKKGDWPGLFKASQQEIKRDPANAAAWFSSGIALAHFKQYNRAVHAYREAIRNQGDYGEAWHKLGGAYAYLKEYDHAIHAYRDALRLEPENAEAWYELANTYYDVKQYAHAIHAYREVLRIQPENPDAWYKLGITYDDMKLYGDAVEAYREALRIQPENTDAWYHLGVDYAIEGDRDKVREVYRVLRELDRAKAEQYFNIYILP
ncbi:tetratricopeptide repeat-containing S1 family peptidase [Nitrosovibrio tenuis]|uniref:Tetratricopeptide repeat-containing protein n=1 Tax=Nitrosovibrio tenuis TaxID=1233 RepID=A0A1H7RB61_9PROT|nr:tetratricopeptide repeat-containing serine protease family protein [Nitrosovibrio tenuis]SEL57433.1 Tetratricopeptide repeat-containing protein [Nitrosovibrio tenuis]